MKILMVAPEAVPFVKVGGLADVVGALTKELSDKGHDVRLVLPKYQHLKHFESAKLSKDSFMRVRMGVQDEYTRIWEAQYPDSKAQVYFFEYEAFFGSSSVYAGPSGNEADNGYRFSFFSRASLDFCYHMNWFPDVIHCHDWTTGLVPAFLNTSDCNETLGRAASVMTIHNLQHQGYCDRHVLRYAGIPQSLFRADGFESFGQVNLLKGGLYHSTKLTTVSPSYAKEIQTEEYGCGLDSVTRFRSPDLIGVINGIDGSEWNSETDEYLEECTFSKKQLANKAICKRKLQSQFALEQKAECPLCVVVSRLYEQKGLDLLLSNLDAMMEQANFQVSILGTGDPELEQAFQHFSEKYQGRIATVLEFDNRLAHLSIAGGDFLLMPSRFEPCGLSQMYAMKYGTIPIVRSTGGLIDSVPVDEGDWSRGCGFSFSSMDQEEFLQVLLSAAHMYENNREALGQMQVRAMSADFSWESSAKKYESIYTWACESRASAFN